MTGYWKACRIKDCVTGFCRISAERKRTAYQVPGLRQCVAQSNPGVFANHKVDSLMLWFFRSINEFKFIVISSIS